MTKLILVRHGLSDANVKHVFAGHSDADLTEQGHEQAKNTAEYIASNYKPDIIYSSDLRRAYKTACHIAEKFGMEVKKDEWLREIYAGEWENKEYDYITEHFGSEYAVWKNDIGNAHPNGGESVQQLGERITTELKKIAEEYAGKTVVVVTHATPIRVSECIWRGCPLSEMKDFPWVSNASVTEVIYSNGVFKFCGVGIDDFQQNLRSVLASNV